MWSVTCRPFSFLPVSDNLPHGAGNFAVACARCVTWRAELASSCGPVSGRFGHRSCVGTSTRGRGATSMRSARDQQEPPVAERSGAFSSILLCAFDDEDAPDSDRAHSACRCSIAQPVSCPRCLLADRDAFEWSSSASRRANRAAAAPMELRASRIIAACGRDPSSI